MATTKSVLTFPQQTTILDNDWLIMSHNTSSGFIASAQNFSKYVIGTNATITDFDKLHNITSSATQLNKLNGYTGNTNDLNAIAGIAALGVTPTVLGYLTGSTGNIQSQINAKASLSSLLTRPYQYTQNIILDGSTTTAKITNTDMFSSIGLAAASYYIPANSVQVSVWKQASATSATQDKSAATQINSAVIGASSTYEVTQINLSSLTVSTTYDFYVTFKVVAK